MMTSPSSTRSVTFRAVLIALILTVPNSYWLMISWGTGGYDSGQSFPTVVSLYFNAVFILLLLIGWNYLTRFVDPRKQFSDGELIVVYLLLTVASSLAGHDMLQLLWPLIPHSTWFATPENEWAELFHHHIPDWLTVKDRDALVPFYHGESTLHIWSHLGLWIRPVFWWSSLIVVLTWMMLCLTVLVQRQWVYREKLTYPIIQIPIQLTKRNGHALFRNRLFWIGFILAGSMNLINGLHFLFPVVPSVGGIGHNPSKVGFDLGQLFTEKPFNAIGYTPLAVYPFVVGLSFFIPLNLSFSIWFFYLLRKIVLVWGTMLGLGHLPGFPFPDEQLFGAWFALGLIAVWVSRKFLIEQIKSAFWRRDEDDEHVRIVRQAAIGLTSGVFFVLFFCFSFGVSAIHALAYFGLFFALAIAITRVRAELGPPTHDVLWHPGGALISFLGTRRFGGKSLTLFTLFRGFNRSYRCHPMPVMLEGFKAAELRSIAPARLVSAIMLVAVVGTISSAWAYYAQGYRYGAAVYGEHWIRGAFLGQLRIWLTTPRDAAPLEIAASIGAFAFTALLTGLHRWFIWWPLHPAGYAIGIGYQTMNWYWVSILLSWLMKLILFRVGGIRAYRKGLPFFTGLVLGEFFIGALWSLAGVILERPMYRFMF